jgi:hypothetical protein
MAAALMAILTIIVLAEGATLYIQLNRLRHDLGATTAELRSLRADQARANSRVSALTNDLSGLRGIVDHNAARDLDTATVVNKAKDAVMPCSPSTPNRRRDRLRGLSDRRRCDLAGDQLPRRSGGRRHQWACATGPSGPFVERGSQLLE